MLGRSYKVHTNKWKVNLGCRYDISILKNPNSDLLQFRVDKLSFADSMKNRYLCIIAKQQVFVGLSTSAKLGLHVTFCSL